MRVNDILGIEPTFIEPSFDELTMEAYTGMVLTQMGEEALLLVDQNNWPLALGVRTGQRWNVANFILRPPGVEVIEKYEDLGGEVLRTTQEDWMVALREYFSYKLMEGTTPALEELSPDRAAKVEDLLASVWRGRRGEVCLDCGCGSGMGSLVLQRLGLTPLAYDNDPTLLSLGLRKGRLIPKHTVCIDAALASDYLPPQPLGLALMAGTINDFTASMWKLILEELLALSSETLVTVETEREADMVSSWAREVDSTVEKFENDRDPFYDRWVCLIKN